MKIAVQYLSDADGTTQAVQISCSDWEKIMSRLKNYEQALKLQSDLKEAFGQVSELRKSNVPKQSLSDFLHEL